MRHVGLHAKAVIGAELAATAHQRGNDDLAAAVGQHRVVRQLLGIGVAVGKVDHAREHLALGLNENAFAMHAVEDRPAHTRDTGLVRLGEQRRCVRVAHEFERGDGQTFVDGSDDRLEMLAMRGGIAGPLGCTRGLRLRRVVERELVDARHHRRGEVSVGRERLRVWELCLRDGGKTKQGDVRLHGETDTD